MNENKTKTIGLICLIIGLLLFCGLLTDMYVKSPFSEYFTTQTMSDNAQADNCGADATSNTTKLILLWNDFYGDPYFKLQPGNTTFITSCHSGINNCYVTTNQSLLEHADAVVIHAFMLGALKTKLPKRFRHDQFFIYVNFESPMLSNVANWNKGFKDIFNLTFTYMYDSDITAEYGKFFQLERKRTVSFAENEVYRSEFQNKKMIAWAVSNCQAFTIRSEYVKELRNYVSVDIYGKCGNMTCPYDNANNTCFQMMSKQYLFYLAFENSYCDDYATEKVFRTLQLQQIPIVLGKYNYEKHFPERSVINVKDYKSPAELADYLIYLSKNWTAYAEYFEWKNSYSFKCWPYNVLDGFCKLCYILHNSSYEYQSSFDPEEYWNQEQLCLTKNEQWSVLHVNENFTMNAKR